MALLHCDFIFFFTLPPSLPLPFFLLLLLLPRINHHSPTIARRLAFSTFPPPPLAKSHKLCMAPCEANLSLLHSSLAPFSNCRGGGGSLSHKKGRRLYQYVKWGDSSQSDLVKTFSPSLQGRSCNVDRAIGFVALPPSPQDGVRINIGMLRSTFLSSCLPLS